MIGAHFFSTLAGTVDGCIVLRNKQGELSQQGKMKMTLPNSPYFQPLGVGKKQNKLKIILIWEKVELQEQMKQDIFVYLIR